MSRKNQVAIKVSNVNKTFRLPHEKTNSIKGIVVNPFRKRAYEKQQVLKDISFEIKRGDFFGIVGRNGSGKSTLLKLIAGIYSPNSGSIEIYGKLTPFIELGVGFNPELTGRENVFLNGALLGFSRKEMSAMYNEIVEFAELEKFMDQKLKNYSSGMQVRLAFSIAIRANTDLLVLDEVLAVGDYNFQQKCFEYFKQLKKEGKTVILVSHDTNALQMFCTKAVLLENGSIKKTGSINDVLKAYASQNMEDQEKKEKSIAKKNKIDRSLEVSTDRVKLKSVRLIDEKGRERTSFGPKEKITIACKYEFYQKTTDPVFGLMIQPQQGGQASFATNTLDKNYKTGVFKPGEVTIRFVICNLYDDGRYIISGAVASSDRSEVFVRFMGIKSFTSVGWSLTAKSLFYPEYEFIIDKN